jgi:hypothetical protein
MKTADAKFNVMPTMEDLKEGGSLAGGVALGLVASHAALNLIKKQDSLLLNGGLALGGFYGAMKVKHPLLKAICAGVATYGAVKCLSIGIKEVTAPGATEGLAGMIPDKVKEALRKFIPTFSGIDEVAGLGNSDDEYVGDLGDNSDYDMSGLGQGSEDPQYAGLGHSLAA